MKTRPKVQLNIDLDLKWSEKLKFNVPMKQEHNVFTVIYDIFILFIIFCVFSFTLEERFVLNALYVEIYVNIHLG